MKRSVLALVLVFAAATAAAAERHSGRVVAVGAAAGTLRLNELVEGMGSETRALERTLRLAPEASIRLVEPPAGREASRWPDAWDARPLAPAELRPGDFVTVTTAGDEAVALEVVRPEASRR